VAEASQAGAPDRASPSTLGSLTVVAEYRSSGRPSALGEMIPLAGNSVTEDVVKERRPLAISYAQADERHRAVHDLLQAQGIVSMLIVPLVVRDRVIGTLGLDSLEPR